MNNVIQRTVTGLVYTSLIVTSLIIHPLFFASVTLFLNIGALLELKRIGNKLLIKTSLYWIILNNIFFFSTLFLLYFQIPGSYFIPVLILIVLLLIIPIFQKSGDPLSTIQFSLFGSLFITLPLILLNLIQQSPLIAGIPYVLALFIIIWTNDTFAYLSGMAFGRHPLFSKLSPKKSWEGLFGGLIMGVVAAFVFNYFFPERGLIHWILFAILSSIASVFGDFIESLLKRKAEIKDSGTLLPGHGGILDRIDSLLLASPVIYIYLFVINSL